jgi:hypothetical protein
MKNCSNAILSTKIESFLADFSQYGWVVMKSPTGQIEVFTVKGRTSRVLTLYFLLHIGVAIRYRIHSLKGQVFPVYDRIKKEGKKDRGGKRQTKGGFPLHDQSPLHRPSLIDHFLAFMFSPLTTFRNVQNKDDQE